MDYKELIEWMLKSGEFEKPKPFLLDVLAYIEKFGKITEKQKESVDNIYFQFTQNKG